MQVIARNSVTLTAILATALFGQFAFVLAADNPPGAEQTVQIVLYPSPAPCPALKYQLLPPFIERRPGNAAVWWNRIPAEQTYAFTEFPKEYDESGRIGTWMKIPLGDPREKVYRESELTKVVHLIKPGRLYSDMERAARFESCDWQLPIREGNPFAIALPEMQQSRGFARMLEAKSRLEIAEGKYDEAVRTLQTGYALARHVGQGPFLVSSLIGVTVASMMSYEVQQFIQQPDSPNLYWALSTLPRPVVDFRPGGEGESSWLYLQFPDLRDLDKKNLSPDGWRELLDKVVAELPRLDCGRSLEECRTVVTLSVIQGYPHAKRYLIERGRSAAEVEAMPVSQVVLLYTVLVYDELSDEQFKWYFLPASEVGNGLDRVDEHMKEVVVAKREIIPLASLFLPASRAAKNAETRCDWNLARLRIFEAMRLYAATHEGRWPDKLSDITEVPIPTNPYDDKAFIYERQGDKAILTSEKGSPGQPRRYEITLMPKAK